MINSKEQIIEYFKSGIKKQKILKLELNMKNFFLIIKIIKELII
jgi:hypothetical protein